MVILASNNELQNINKNINVTVQTVFVVAAEPFQGIYKVRLWIGQDVLCSVIKQYFYSPTTELHDRRL